MGRAQTVSERLYAVADTQVLGTEDVHGRLTCGPPGTGVLPENGRLMLSVWARITRDTELGRTTAAAGHYVDQTDWVDFFDPKAAAFYWNNQRERLLKLGIDAWWQDATEPENDDLVGRRTAAGRGERVRLAYPWHVTRTVYEGQRQALPNQRVMILTRSAFPGQHRHAAATWSGDTGNPRPKLGREAGGLLGRVCPLRGLSRLTVRRPAASRWREHDSGCRLRVGCASFDVRGTAVSR